MEPVFGRYIVPCREFKGNLALTAGYTDMYRSAAQGDWRVVETIDFEAEQHPHLLKREFVGQVHPVLRDSEGFERYLVPGVVDVWFRHEVREARRRGSWGAHLHVTESAPDVGYYRTHRPSSLRAET